MGKSTGWNERQFFSRLNPRSLEIVQTTKACGFLRSSAYTKVSWLMGFSPPAFPGFAQWP
jgi:hypothetical protein